jgi:hypothetical protein
MPSAFNRDTQRPSVFFKVWVMNGGLSISTDRLTVSYEKNERIKIFLNKLNFVFVFVEELVAEHEKCKNMESELEVTMNEFQGY